MKKDYSVIDFAKFILSIGIISIHTLNTEQPAGFIVNIIARIGVPLFLVFTGFFMRETIRNSDYKKAALYVKRIITIYLIWCVLYIPLNADKLFYPSTLIKKALMMIQKFLFVGVSIHLWYLPASAIAVLLLTFLYNKLNRKLLYVIVIGLYVFAMLGDSYYGILPFVIKRFMNLYIYYFGGTVTSFSWTLIFVLFGVELADKKHQANPWYFAVIYVLFIAEHVVLEYSGIARDHNMSILLLLLVPILFNCILQLEEKGITIQHGFMYRKLSLLIYLIHLFVRQLFMWESLQKSFLLFALTTIFSVAISYIWYLVSTRKQMNA